VIFLFEINFAEGWDKYFSKLGKPEKERIWKKIISLFKKLVEEVED